MKTIKKVLNSSVVLAEDEKKKEYVLLGKGIGYGKKIGSLIQEDLADQVFIPVDHAKKEHFLEIMNDIDPIYLELTQQIVHYAEKHLGTKLNPGIYFTLMDHLHFASERIKNDIAITNRLFWEVKNYYRDEFNVGAFAVRLLNEHLAIELPEEEAANIAFHLINAQGEKENSRDAMKAAKLTGNIINLVRYTLNVNMDTEDIHYYRFVTHVKFFVERFFSEKMLVSNDMTLYEQISKSYPVAMKAANKIEAYIKDAYGKAITEEELLYLAVHIQRLLSQNKL